MSRSYVLGFPFVFGNSSRGVEQLNHVNPLVLIKQRGPLHSQGINGWGGLINEGEEPSDAMIREFLEETGIRTSTISWTKFAIVSGDGWELICFATRISLEDANRVVASKETYNLAGGNAELPPWPVVHSWFESSKAAYHVAWLMPLAAHIVGCHLKVMDPIVIGSVGVES